MYVDFIPEKIKNQSGYVSGPFFQTFSTLLDRANLWLGYRRNVQVLCAETLSIRAKEPGTNHFLPAAAATTEYFFSSKTYHEERELNGLRLWYIQHEGEMLQNHQLGLAVIVPKQLDGKLWDTKPQFEPVSKTVMRINQQLKHNPLPGRVLNIESVPLRCCGSSPLDPDLTYHPPSVFHLFVIKIFYLRAAEVHETIGYQDFVPVRLKTRDGRAAYGPLHETCRRAARWLRQQQTNLHVTNIQTIDVKLRKHEPRVDAERPAQWLKLSSRVVSCLRVWYTVAHRLTTAPATAAVRTISYRTFEPAIIATGGTDIKANYETIPELVVRVGRWLVETGPKIISIETLCVHVEKWKSVPDPENPMRPVCLSSKTVIRIFVDGDYGEADSSRSNVKLVPKKLGAVRNKTICAVS